MLKIEKFILPDIDVENFDFTLLSELKKESPRYDKGRKIESNYTHEDDLIVKKTFNDVLDIDGNLTGLEMRIDWYNENGSIGITKNQIIKNLNIYEVETLLRTRRLRSIDFLVAGAKDTPIESHVNELFKRYKEEVDLYVYNNSDDFKNIVINESESPYKEYLEIIVAPPSDKYPSGVTVKDGILYQIS